MENSVKTHLVLISILSMGIPSLATGNSWEKTVSNDSPNPELSYKILQQPIVDFLRLVARDADVQIDITHHVSGTLESFTASGDTAAILDAVASQANLQWFEFNGTFYISTADEAEVRLLRFETVPSDAIVKALEEIGLTQNRFPMTVSSTGKTIAFSGPPKLLALKEAVIEGVKSETPAPEPRVVQEWPAPKVELAPRPEAEGGVTIFRNLSRSKQY